MKAEIESCQISAHGFQLCGCPGHFNSAGQCWELDSSIGGGYYWLYSQEDLFYIRIHDFFFHEDTTLTFHWPATLSITVYDSISGEELEPFRELNAGCVKTFIGGNGSYPIRIRKQVPIHSIGIEITQDYCNEIIRRLYPDSYRQLLPIFTEIDQTENFPEMDKLLHEIEMWRGTGVAAALYYESKVMEALRLIVEFQQNKPPQEIHRVSKEDMQRLQMLTAYIHDHLAESIPQKQMVQISCMGATKLKTVFREAYGCTITEYIQHHRMMQAKDLLHQTEQSIGQISASVGYASASRFSDLFRRCTGTLPSEYRKERARS